MGLLGQSPTDDRYREFFRAQVIKDACMAHRVEKALKTFDRVVVVLGLGHCEYGYGVPERVNEND